MIAGLDSSFDRPTPAIIEQARRGGVGLWMGYIATRGGVGLASAWDRASFEVARGLGSTPVAMASGFDDPFALRQLAASWDVRLCLDCEGGGLRDLGAWTQAWLDASGAGIYGNARVHVTRAAFHILAAYPGFDPGATWSDVVFRRPEGPLGWQWEGTHSEFGLSVDRGWYDDWFVAPTGALRRFRMDNRYSWVRSDSGEIVLIDHLNATYRANVTGYQVHAALAAQQGVAPWAQVSDAELAALLATLTQIGVPPAI